MEIIIKGNAKEIAALALELQGRHNKAKKRAVNIESPSETIDKAFKWALSNATRDMPDSEKLVLSERKGENMCFGLF